MTKYLLWVSRNAGMDYVCEMAGFDLGPLERRGKQLDGQHLRWYIETTDGDFVKGSALHKAILDFLERVNQ